MTHSPEIWSDRKRMAEEVCAVGDGFVEIGRAWGTSRIYAYREVRERWPDLYSRLRSRQFKTSVDPSEAIRRCEAVVRGGKSFAAIARSLGLAAPTLRMWLRRNAPDGADQLLKDYSDDWSIAA